jgi:hypothetical protein
VRVARWRCFVAVPVSSLQASASRFASGLPWTGFLNLRSRTLQWRLLPGSEASDYLEVLQTVIAGWYRSQSVSSDGLTEVNRSGDPISAERADPSTGRAMLPLG